MTLTHALNVLEADGLIRLAAAQPELAYLFQHALIQDAAYQSLVKVNRRMLHTAVGESLEQLYPARLTSPELAPVLARHFAEGGDRKRALHYYTLAGQAAMGLYANAEAIHHFGLALEFATSDPGERQAALDLFLMRGHALELSAQDAEAIKNYQALENWAVARDDRQARLSGMAARATIYVKPSVEQNLALGYELSQQALSLARELGDRPAEAKVLWNLLQHQLAAGNMPAALEYGEQGLQIARDEGLREQIAYLLTDLYKVYALLGKQAQTVAAVTEARALWRELGVLNMLADNLASTAMYHIVTGHYDEGVALSAEALQVSRTIGNPWNQSYALFIVDMVHFDRGEIGRAIAVTQECSRLAEQAGFAEGLNQSTLDRALMYAYLGALPLAFAAAHELQARGQSGVAYADSILQAEALMTTLLVRSGRLAEAQAAFERSSLPQDPAALQNQFIVLHLLISHSLAELALSKGQPGRALELAENLVAHYRRDGVRLLFSDALWFQGRALAASGRLDEAQSVLDTARAEAEDLGSRRILWQILAELADLAAQRGQPAGALALRQQAAGHIHYIAEHAGAAGLRESFLNRADVRATLAYAGPGDT